MWVPAADAENADGELTSETPVQTDVDGIVVVAPPSVPSGSGPAKSQQPVAQPQQDAAPGVPGVPVHHSRTNFKHKFSQSGRRKSHAANVVITSTPKAGASAQWVNF